MKWVVLAIIVAIGAYTYLTLHYRKPGRAFQPYADLKDRANTKRLLDAGFQRVDLEADMPTDFAGRGGEIGASASQGGLPSDLRASLIAKPDLPAEILGVYGATDLNSLFAYPVNFKCTLPDNNFQLAGAQLYLHGEEIIITPELARLSGGLLSRSRENLIRVTVPAGTLKPGRYRVTLVGAQSSRAWTLQVH